MTHLYSGKPWQSLSDLLGLLKKRGITVANEQQALAYLQKIGYYRLTGYAHPFREFTGLCSTFDHSNPIPTKKNMPVSKRLALDAFKPNTSFEMIIALYVFDKKLRMLVMDAVERIEIAIRGQMVHLLGELSPLAYLDGVHFRASFSSYDNRCGLSEHHDWLTKQGGLLSRSKEDFMMHHRNEKKLPVPIWVACEVWDFGATSRLFAGMKEADQHKISNVYGLSNGAILASWLRSISYLRNVCAHHCRLWNRNIVESPKLPPESAFRWISHFTGSEISNIRDRPFYLLCILGQLLTTINPNSLWIERLMNHLETLPEMSIFEMGIKNMGAMDNWKEVLADIKNP